MERPPIQQLQASAVQFLIDGHEEDAASVLLSCEIEAVWTDSETWYPQGLDLVIKAPRAVYDILTDSKNSSGQAVHRALAAVLPPYVVLGDVTIHVGLIDIDEHWRDELLEIARGAGVNNQAVSAAQVTLWNQLRFRSVTESRIARALDEAGVMFLPNCLARVTENGRRVTREADFLICHEGKWGILEVDGEQWHPPGRAAVDHARDRIFHGHGIVLVQHFDAVECYEEPKFVVMNFLKLLERSS